VEVRIRAKVEHGIRVIKRVFGFTKVRYRGGEEHPSGADRLWSCQSVHRSASVAAGLMARRHNQSLQSAIRHAKHPTAAIVPQSDMRQGRPSAGLVKPSI